MVYRKSCNSDDSPEYGARCGRIIRYRDGVPVLSHPCQCKPPGLFRRLYQFFFGVSIRYGDAYMCQHGYSWKWDMLEWVAVKSPGSWKQ